MGKQLGDFHSLHSRDQSMKMSLYQKMQADVYIIGKELTRTTMKIEYTYPAIREKNGVQ